jgi:hypothetical protein
MKYLFLFFIGIQAIFAQQTESFYLSFYKPSITSTRSLPESSLSGDVMNQKIERNGLSIMFGVERTMLEEFFDSFFIGVFIGGGALGDDIREFIMGADIKKMYWISKGVIAVPFSLGFAYHTSGYGQYIPDGYNYGAYDNNSEDAKRFKTKDVYFTSVDIMPSMDLQFFINERFSFYAGYMNRVRIELQTVHSKELQIENIVKEEERIFRIPGTLRFGAKLYYR